ncbi:MAG: hypothetical protein IT458_17220, partial [Planctomycetes bacterium]|nr:hypothetical protein [Planctomycetota bacterium]
MNAIAIGSLALALCAAGAAAQASQPGSTASRPHAEAKLDEGLAAVRGHVPVFVRMADQLLPDAAAYPAFCARNRGQKRTELRARTLADLQARAERSFAAVRAAVGSLEAGGHLREVTRFWIVNGFAA